MKEINLFKNIDTPQEPKREFLTRKSRKLIEENGLIIDENTDPYKSFDDRERFFIQKCQDENGNEVVAKISSNDEEGKEILSREANLYELLHNSIKQAKKDGHDINISFPQIIKKLSDENFEGIVIDFIEDDKEKKQNLSKEEKINIFLKAIRNMHKMPVPESELQKSYTDRAVDIIPANEFKRRWDNKIPELVKRNILSEQEGSKLFKLINDNQELIDSYPLKFDHGDFHGGNIAYSIDTKTGEPNITLMDLEALRITNEFNSIAQIANREELARFIQLPEYKERINSLPNVEEQAKEAFDLLKEGGVAEELEKEFINSSQNPEKAKKIYQIMRIHEAIETLSQIDPNAKPPYDTKKLIYEKILHRLL